MAKKQVLDGSPVQKDGVKGEVLMSINEICREFNKSHVYVSRAIQQGWLPYTKKVSINKNSTQFKYLVARSIVEAWRKRCNSKARRTDGRRKYNTYMTQKEHQQFEEWKKQQNVQIPTNLANPGKSTK